MVELRESELNKMCEDFEKMKFKAEAWWPSIEDIKKYLEPHIKADINFAVWITETANEPQTEEEKASRKYLLKLIYENLVVVDD